MNSSQQQITLTPELMDFIRNEVFQSFANSIKKLDEDERLSNWTNWHIIFGFNAGVIHTYRILRDNVTKNMNDGARISKGLDIQFVADAAEELGFDDIANFAFEESGRNV